ncbi:MAG: hypothetical protein HC845_03425, partial [Akkermansiaceae bacterium]|nr:hypothetical protein [Akkermansiaceae bacterium]
MPQSNAVFLAGTMHIAGNRRLRFDKVLPWHIYRVIPYDSFHKRMIRRTTPLFASIALLAPSTGSALAEEFSFDILCAKARKMAAEPYSVPKQDLADFWKNLSYDQHRDIRFNMESGQWYAEKAPFSVDFFHPGWTAKKTVKIHEVIGGQAQFLTFDQSLFNYGKQVVPAGTPPPPGYAGWRARTHLNS